MTPATKPVDKKLADDHRVGKQLEVESTSDEFLDDLLDVRGDLLSASLEPLSRRAGEP